jgi:hypothetical protein
MQNTYVAFIYIIKLEELLDSLPEVLDGHLDGFHDAVVLIRPLLPQLAVPTHTRVRNNWIFQTQR